MSECPECGMRDDDWFLCRREPCVAINRAVTVAAEASADLYARLQEQVETLKAELASAMKAADEYAPRALAAEAERDRLRALAERVCWFDWSANDEDAVQAIADLRAALQKEPQP